MEKTQIGQNFFIPMPVVLVGTQVNGKDNVMTVGWCARANANPPMILCGIGNHHHTARGIAETQTFSVNIPSSALLEKTDIVATPGNGFGEHGEGYVRMVITVDRGRLKEAVKRIKERL